MLKSDKLEFERGAAAKTENQDRYNGKENRHHDRDGRAGSQKSPASLSPVEILSKDRVWRSRARSKTAPQRRGRRSRRPHHICTVAGQVPGGLSTIDDDRLMFSGFKMAHTRSATHCNLALIGVGS